MLNIIKKNIKYILFSFVFITINAFLLRNAHIFNRDNFSIKTFFVVLFISVTLEIIYSLLIYKIIKNAFKIEKIFLMIIIPIGILYLVLLPPGGVPDENGHFFRAYEISSGYLISEKNENNYGGNELPIQVSDLLLNKEEDYSDLIDNLNEKKDNKTNFLIFSNTSLYCFICYIPQVIGILLGKLFNLQYLYCAYLGRIVNFSVWVLLIYYAIKIIPFLKKEVLLISLMPITIQEAISLSPDALTISACIFLISYILYFIYDKKKQLSKLDISLLFITCIVVSFCKIVYFPLILLLILIPVDRFKSKKQKTFITSIIIITCLLANLAWLKIASNYLVEFNKGVDSFKQAKYILLNPISFIQTIINTFASKPEILLSTFSHSLGPLSINLNYYYVIATIAIFVYYITINKQSTITISIFEKIIYCGTFFLIFLLICSSLYVQWTPYRSVIIDGIQGRYFIPILIMIPLFLLNSRKNKDKIKKITKEQVNYYTTMFIIFENIYALFLIFNEFL